MNRLLPVHMTGKTVWRTISGTYTLEDIWTGLQDSYKKMTEDVKEKYGVEVKKLAALGFSAMMHGYMHLMKTMSS